MAKKTCGTVLHYEVRVGIRLFREKDGKKVYRYKCPSCGDMGENNGHPKKCRRPLPIRG